MTKDEVEALCACLKSGEYDGTHIMRAWIALREQHAEIERLQAAMKGWSSYAWKDRCYVDDVQQYFDSVLKGDAPTSLDGIEVYDEQLGKSP